ncbi:hypothetical protein TSOC_002610 [Tetrabaena socialis]|uniref:Uncharacterized protein n=1 Tax=Tetrabaena socialis TaxID=47790 RepID=A0A2J8ADN3_9CHLO|nr:hypothetical protein TSOC_002610 [Tetrabaena socialis]|eukprot:PNH10628.1 hypothetical protein TSOC_002610 [Tetrabaena socialis]
MLLQKSAGRARTGARSQTAPFSGIQRMVVLPRAQAGGGGGPVPEPAPQPLHSATPTSRRAALLAAPAAAAAVAAVLDALLMAPRPAAAAVASDLDSLPSTSGRVEVDTTITHAVALTIGIADRALKPSGERMIGDKTIIPPAEPLGTVVIGPGPVPRLNGQNIVFGRVLDGMSIVSQVAQVPVFGPSPVGNSAAFNSLASAIGDDRAANVRRKYGKPLKAVVILGSEVLQEVPAGML